MIPYCYFCNLNEKRKKLGFATTAIHHAQEPDKWRCGAVVTPIVTTSTFAQPTPSIDHGFKNFYGRCGNPTRDTLEEVLAALDNGRHGFCFATGMAAIVTINSLLSEGDHILCCDDVYGGTYKLFSKISSRMGIDTTYIDFTDLKQVQMAVRRNTKMFWVETPSNPMMKVIDINAVSKIAHKYDDIILVVDNTFMTPYFQKPLDHGADIVAYSLTKFMNGHSDVIMGAAVVHNDELAEQLRMLQMVMGTVPSTFDCYLVNRSLKTLAVRMEQHHKSGIEVALWLQKHPMIKEVYHPGLPGHPQEEITQKQTTGCSSVFSFKHMGGLKESQKFLTSLRVFILAVSLGGFESLAELPTTMTHASMPEKIKQQLGITDALIRLSIGLENTKDLIADLDQAFNKAFNNKSIQTYQLE